MGHWERSPPILPIRGAGGVDLSPDPGSFTDLEKLSIEELKKLLNELNAIQERQQGRLSPEQATFKNAVEAALAAISSKKGEVI